MNTPQSEYEKALADTHKNHKSWDGLSYDLRPLFDAGFDSGIAHANAVLAQDVVIEWREVSEEGNLVCQEGWIGKYRVAIIWKNTNAAYFAELFDGYETSGMCDTLEAAQAEAVRQVTALKNCLIAALNEKEEGK